MLKWPQELRSLKQRIFFNNDDCQIVEVATREYAY